MSKIRFDQRHPGPEYMDDFQIDDPILEVTLKEITFINKVLGGNAVTFHALQKLIAQSKQSNVILADLGCGRGDMMAAMQKKLGMESSRIQFIGMDASKESVRLANARWPRSSFKFYCTNVMEEEFLSIPFDWAFCTLFLHHLTDSQIITLLSRLRSRNCVVVVNDLHRHPLAYYLIKWLTQLFSKSYMVKHDAPISVLRGFSKTELTNLARLAGFEQIRISWKWAFRWQLVLQ
jgi:2-polyprenyl-3-methyl-5-hydroxy-6-metoxy-1,4-benzoquinol methylase